MGRSADQERIGPTDQHDADDTGCHLLHVDMDAFFVSVEVRRDRSLAGKPVIVGGAGGYGVVSSASYEARRYGVRSAMPMSRALSLCPDAIVVSHGSDYGAVSREVMDLLRDVTPKVQPLSLDEAFLDVRGAQRLIGAPSQIARGIRERMARELELTCSVGVASRLFVAKIASTRCKPDGMLVVPKDETLEFLAPLPVSALWGVGPKATAKLAGIGIHTVLDLRQARRQTLVSTLGRAAAAHLSALANGHDPRAVTPERVEKSISAEETFFHPLTDHRTIESELVALSNKVARRLRAADQRTRSVAIKVRTADFATHTRTSTLPEPTDVARVLLEQSIAMWRAAERETVDGRAIRLLGVRAHGLVDAGSQPEQLALATEDVARAQQWAGAERALDQIAARFGSKSVRPASQLRPQGWPGARREGERQ